MTKRAERFLLLLTDLMTINLSWIVYSYFRLNVGIFKLFGEPSLYLAGAAIYAYWFLVFLAVGLYESWFAKSRFDEISTLLKTTFFGVLFLFAAIFIDDIQQGVASDARFLIFIYWAALFTFVGIGRLFNRTLQRKLLFKGIGRRKVFIVGFNEKGKEIHEMLLKYRALGLDPVGYIAVLPENVGKEHMGIKVLGRTNEIKDLIVKYNVKEIIIALQTKHEDVFLEVLENTQELDVRIKISPDLYEIVTGQARTSQIYGMPLIDISPRLMPEWEKAVKRGMDIVLSLIFLIITLPITIITAILIKLESPGPVLFKQERAGLNGKPFMMYKFRSMRADAEKNTGPVWAQKNDPRVTRVGKFIRKVRIDEIPQMINILKGEMSLVGPRPERPVFVEKLSKEIPLYKKRLTVRPGLTGWAQVKHKYDETIDDVRTKLRYDLFYIENMSIRMDLKIMFRTVFVMLFGLGHYE